MWNSVPSLVERWMNEFWVVVPHGPDSQKVPFGSIASIGSPSVRCGSTTVADENFAFHVP